MNTRALRTATTRYLDAEARLAKLRGRLLTLLFNQTGAPDHMTACEKTMGDTHPCTCGADALRRALGRYTLPEDDELGG
jgi:hypothetical protein